MRFLIGVLLLVPALFGAGRHSGSVRAADQFIPGATVTARQGGAQVVVYTDENGGYALDLTPGVWEIDIQMFGFRTLHGQVRIGDEETHRDWTLEMPRSGELAPSTQKPAVTVTAKTPKPADSPQPPTAAAPTGGRRGQFAGGGRGQFGGGERGPRQGRGQVQQAQQPGFQNANVTATVAGQQALAATAEAPPVEPDLASDDSFIVNGSQSGGLGAAADEQRQRDRMAGRGGPGGPGGPAAVPAGLSLAAAGFNVNPDSLGGFGAAGVNGGFGPDTGGGFGGPGGGPGGGGPGGARGGAGGGGGGRGGRGGQQQNARNGRGRGPFNGQFAQFGNRRRTQPAYTGSLALNVTNSALNAAPFSLNGQTVHKPYAGSERVAFNIGGPVRIPKLVTNDRWFVYLTLQDNISKNGSYSTAAVPTLAERNGDFSGTTVRHLPITIYDPTSHTPFPGNFIPATRMNPASVALLQYFPLPMFSGVVQNYAITPSTPSVNNAIGVRLNGPLTTKDSLSINQQYSGSHSTSEALFGFQDARSGYGLSANVGWRHTFKPRFNNNATLAFSRNTSKATPYFAYKTNIEGSLGIIGPDESPLDYGPPSLSFTNFGGLSDGMASLSRSQTTNFTDTVTWVVQRKHNFNFGFGYRRMQQNSLSYANSRGAYSFSGLLTGGLGPDGAQIQGTGFDFADFLLGYPQTTSLRIGNSNNYFRGQAWNVYGVDDFRAGRGLTLNLGLRWEYFTPYTELRGHLANLDVAPGYAEVAVVTPASPNGPWGGTYPASLLNPDKNNFSPRFGLAWRPSQKHSRVIRLGYSIFFSGAAYGQLAAKMATQPPFATTGSLSTSLDAPLTLQTGLPTQASQVSSTYAINPNYKLAYAQTWVAAIQQTLPANLLIELEYVGTKGTGLTELFVPNSFPPGTVLTPAQQAGVPSGPGNATGFVYETDTGDSIYHSGQIRLTRRFSRGMSAMALYTLSKSIDDASTFAGGSGGTVVQNWQDISAERGLSSFNQHQALSLTYMLSSPVGIHGLWRNGGWKTKAFSGWTLSSTFTYHTGNPLTATIPYINGSGRSAVVGQLRAEATGLSMAGTEGAYFNLNAFTLPAAGEYGDAGRNTITGPGLYSLNGALNRAWRFGDTRRQLQLRLSANNAFNHVQITGFGTQVNAATYGLATAASGTRTVQLMLRLNF